MEEEEERMEEAAAAAAAFKADGLKTIQSRRTRRGSLSLPLLP